MTRPVREAKESHRGFQAGAGRTFAARREHAYVTFLTACCLGLATLIAVASVSVQAVTAAALQ
jgi:hypothetical protein